MRITNLESRKENEEEGQDIPNKSCEKEEGDERVNAQEKDDYYEDAKNVESNKSKETKQMSEDEEGKEQSKYSPGNEAVDWTIESVEITKDVFIDDDKENEEADSGSHTKKTRI